MISWHSADRLTKGFYTQFWHPRNKILEALFPGKVGVGTAPLDSLQVHSFLGLVHPFTGEDTLIVRNRHFDEKPRQFVLPGTPWIDLDPLCLSFLLW